MNQVKINVPDGYELKQEGNTYTIVEKEFELEVGKDYAHKDGLGIVIDRKKGNGNLGFWRGVFFNNMTCDQPESWREATEEEVTEAFEKECARRLGEDWRDAKMKTHANGEKVVLNTGNHEPFIKKFEGVGWAVWNKNGCVYYEGKWAEKLEEPKFAENLEDIERPWYVNTFGYVLKDSDEICQGKNHLPTEELTKGLLALTQLLSFRHDVWEKEGKPEDDEGWYGIILTVSEQKPRVSLLGEIKTEFRFKKEETAEWFLEAHRGLLLEYFTKLVR